MMRKSFYVCFLVMAATLMQPLHAQKKIKDPVLLDFGTQKVTKSEFERVYAKNNGGLDAVKSQTPEQYREYLDLYINFKRKVFEAEALALDKTPAFEQEFATYRKQLAQPYLSAKEVEDHLIQEAFDRSGSLVHASHLLVTIPANLTPEDTLTAYKRTLAFRDSITSGKISFGDLAQAVSEDPSARENAGDLGYFSVFDMVYPFESAAYNTAVGQVSMPIRTRFGYHLIYVQDKLPSEGRKSAAHIIIRLGDRYSGGNDSAQAEKKIREIYSKLKEGADFAEMAAQYSDDPSTAEKGGDLGFSRLLPEMEVQKLKLGKGEFSEPFETRFGWHILTVTDVEGVQSFEEARSGLKQRIARDSRAQLSREAMLEKIRKENKYSFDQAAFDDFKQTLDVNFARGNWKPDSTKSALYARTMFSLNGDAYNATLQDFIDYYISTRSRQPRLGPAEAADEISKGFIETKLMDYEEARLPEKNPDFRYLVQEYRDGILLFTLMEQKVWKKAVEDTTGLKQFYKDHTSDFNANEMVDVREFRSTDKDAVKEAHDFLVAGKTEQEVDSILNAESPLRLRITTQSYEKGKGELADDFFTKPIGYIGDVTDLGSYARVLVVLEKFPAGIKPFEKARSESITRYQDYLEQEWLKSLAQSYPVKINEKVFAKLYK